MCHPVTCKRRIGTITFQCGIERRSVSVKCVNGNNRCRVWTRSSSTLCTSAPSPTPSTPPASLPASSVSATPTATASSTSRSFSRRCACRQAGQYIRLRLHKHGRMVARWLQLEMGIERFVLAIGQPTISRQKKFVRTNSAKCNFCQEIFKKLQN